MISNIIKRSRQLKRILEAEGHHAAGDHVRRTVGRFISPKVDRLPVRTNDVIGVDFRNLPVWRRLERTPEQPLDINWIITPAGPGSGGHTTIFRIANFLQSKGHRNRVYLYDNYNSDMGTYVAAIRGYYGFKGEIQSIDDGIEDADVVIATAWPTAYAACASTCAGKRFYFVQDFEPSFYAAGSENVLAENTYRMGFHALTAGRWLAAKLKNEFGMPADFFDFGCDNLRYERLANARREGVAFYARPGAARRGFELGIMTLELFARVHPNVQLHFYGDTARNFPFKTIDHGHVTPERLNEIYNRCYAGLTLSLTNVSLVPYEMLAAGCIPVVNDAEHNRIVLNNPYVTYADADPASLAGALSKLVTLQNFDRYSEEASNSVRSASWDGAGAAVEIALKSALE